MSDKLKNILAVNMRRFNTKNLSEQQLDMFKMDTDNEYYVDRYDDSAYEDMHRDIVKAIEKKDGRAAKRIGERLLKFMSVDVYKELEALKQAEPKEWKYSDARRFVDSVQLVDHDVIKDAVNVLKVSPQNMAAMDTLKDIISRLASYMD